MDHSNQNCESPVFGEKMQIRNQPDQIPWLELIVNETCSKDLDE